MRGDKMSRTTNKIALPSIKTGAIAASTVMLGVLVQATLSGLPASAVDLGGGRTFFDQSPRLIRTAASLTSSRTPSTYQFTIEVPSDAGEPLKAVTITQKPNAERIKFDVSENRAFIGDSFAGGPQLSLANIGGIQPSDSNEVTVVFDQPVEPGNTVTVSLKAKKNPHSGGVYLFGVTAFPVGNNSPGLYLGTARLHFTQD